MTYRMFAVYTLDTTGRAAWSLNEGESLAQVEDDVRSAGPTWTPPTHYVQVTARELTADEQRDLLEDYDGLDWHLAHNNPAVAPAPGEDDPAEMFCETCSHPMTEHTFFPGEDAHTLGSPAPSCWGQCRPDDTTLIDHSCDCEGFILYPKA